MKKFKLTRNPRKIIRGVAILLGMLITGVGAVITAMAPALMILTLITGGIVDVTSHPMEISIGTVLFAVFSFLCYKLHKMAMK